jgi:3-oxoacid CoA-transferase subunit A
LHWYDKNVKGYVMYEPDYPNIKYFEDGNAYEILGKSILVIGGAYSVDKWYRLQMAGVTSSLDKDYLNPRKTGWFPDEQLLDWEMTAIKKEHFGKHYDIILTHTCPISWEPTDLFIAGLDQSKVDKSMEKFLEEVKEKVDWGIWLFGHYHADRLVRPFVEMLFMDIEDLAHIIERWERPDQIDWWLEKDPNYYMGV